jgi:siroheme synthase (precorrin-2 oxidase/ferrochelatase)
MNDPPDEKVIPFPEEEERVRRWWQKLMESPQGDKISELSRRVFNNPEKPKKD